MIPILLPNNLENNNKDDKKRVLSDLQIDFFRIYGFIVLKGLIICEKIEKARKDAEALIQEDIKQQEKESTYIFEKLPESSRPS